MNIFQRLLFYFYGKVSQYSIFPFTDFFKIKKKPRKSVRAKKPMALNNSERKGKPK